MFLIQLNDRVDGRGEPSHPQFPGLPCGTIVGCTSTLDEAKGRAQAAMDRVTDPVIVSYGWVIMAVQVGDVSLDGVLRLDRWFQWLRYGTDRSMPFVYKRSFLPVPAPHPRGARRSPRAASVHDALLQWNLDTLVPAPIVQSQPDTPVRSLTESIWQLSHNPPTS